jgi:hypothetical protein
MTALARVKLQLFKDFGNANSSTRGLPCTHAGDIGAPSAGNAGFVVIQTHLSLGFRLNAKQLSASRRCDRRWRPQLRDQPQDIGEQNSGDGDLGHLEGDITAVADDVDGLSSTAS